MKILNPHVLAECRQNPLLYAIYRTLRQHYDSDIDPLHNPEWCAEQRQLEMADLIVARGMLRAAIGEWITL